MEGTLPVALTCSLNLPLYYTYTNQHCISISNKTNKTKPISTYGSMFSEKINMETFQNFKSQCSVTKHIIPLIKLTYYTYKWCCLKTLKPQLLEVWSQQGDLWDKWKLTFIIELLCSCDYGNIQKLFNYLCYADHNNVHSWLAALTVSQRLKMSRNKATLIKKKDFQWYKKTPKTKPQTKTKCGLNKLKQQPSLLILTKQLREHVQLNGKRMRSFFHCLSGHRVNLVCWDEEGSWSDIGGLHGITGTFLTDDFCQVAKRRPTCL